MRSRAQRSRGHAARAADVGFGGEHRNAHAHGDAEVGVPIFGDGRAAVGLGAHGSDRLGIDRQGAGHRNGARGRHECTCVALEARPSQCGSELDVAVAGRCGVVGVAILVRVGQRTLGAARLGQAVGRARACGGEVAQPCAALGVEGLFLGVEELGLVARHPDEIGFAVFEADDGGAAVALAVDHAITGLQAVVGTEVDGVGGRVDDARGARIEGDGRGGLHGDAVGCARPDCADVAQPGATTGLRLGLGVVELGLVARHVDEVGLAVLETADVDAALTMAVDDAIAGLQPMVGAEVDGVGARIDDARRARVECDGFGFSARAAFRGLRLHVEHEVRVRGQRGEAGGRHQCVTADRGLGVCEHQAEAERRTGTARRAVRNRLRVGGIACGDDELRGRGERGGPGHLGMGFGEDRSAGHRGIGVRVIAWVAGQHVVRQHGRTRADVDAARRGGDRGAALHRNPCLGNRIQDADLEAAQLEAGHVEDLRGNGREVERAGIDRAAEDIHGRGRVRPHQIDERRVLRGVGRAHVDRHLAKHGDVAVDVAVDLDRLGAVDVERLKRERARARVLHHEPIVHSGEVIGQKLVRTVEGDVQRGPGTGVERPAESEIDGQQVRELPPDRDASEVELRVDVDCEHRVVADQVRREKRRAVKELKDVLSAHVLAESQREVRSAENLEIDVRLRPKWLERRGERRQCRRRRPRRLRHGIGIGGRGVAQRRERRAVKPVGEQRGEHRAQDGALPHRIAAAAGGVHQVGPARVVVGVGGGVRLREGDQIAAQLDEGFRGVADLLDEDRAGNHVPVGDVAQFDPELRAREGVRAEQPVGKALVLQTGKRGIARVAALVQRRRLADSKSRAAVLDRVLRVAGRRDVLVGMGRVVEVVDELRDVCQPGGVDLVLLSGDDRRRPNRRARAVVLGADAEQRRRFSKVVLAPHLVGVDRGQPRRVAGTRQRRREHVAAVVTVQVEQAEVVAVAGEIREQVAQLARPCGLTVGRRFHEEKQLRQRDGVGVGGEVGLVEERIVAQAPFGRRVERRAEHARGQNAERRHGLMVGEEVVAQAEQRVETLVIARLEDGQDIADGADLQANGREVHLGPQLEQELKGLGSDAEALLELLAEVVLDLGFVVEERLLEGQEEGLDRLDDGRHEVIDELRDGAQSRAHVAREIGQPDGRQQILVDVPVALVVVAVRVVELVEEDIEHAHTGLGLAAEIVALEWVVRVQQQIGRGVLLVRLLALDVLQVALAVRVPHRLGEGQAHLGPVLDSRVDVLDPVVEIGTEQLFGARLRDQRIDLRRSILQKELGEVLPRATLNGFQLQLVL